MLKTSQATEEQEKLKSLLIDLYCAIIGAIHPDTNHLATHKVRATIAKAMRSRDLLQHSLPALHYKGTSCF